MPKMKTSSGARKRFKRTGNGGFKHRCANRNHILTKKQQKRKRHLRGLQDVAPADKKLVLRLMPSK